jgi:hypothetical protein
MTETLPKFKPAALVKPTLDTPFHIDFEWWEREARDFRVYLRSYLCSEHRTIFERHTDIEEIDWIDEDTAEVTRVNGLQHILRVHCSLQPDYITPSTSLIDAVFRVFLANNNKPLTPAELGARTRRDPATIVRTLSGHRVYKGLRPFTGD